MAALLVASGVVVPMALYIAIGVAVRRAGYVTRTTMHQVDGLAFRTFMPATLFRSIYVADLSQSASSGGFLFALVCIGVIFAMSIVVPKRFLKDPRQAASLGQAIVRSNYVVFGVAVSDAVYGRGNSASVALMGAVVVPVLSLLAVIVLVSGTGTKHSFGETFRSILRNPIILSAAAALFFKLLRIRIPDLLYSVLEGLADVTTTLCFISLGVGLDFKELHGNRRALVIGNVFRLVVIPLIFLPLSVLLGFRGPTLCALLVLFCAPAAISSYPMAVAMGADGPLAGQLVFTTTLLSIITIFIATFTLSFFQLL